MIRYRSFYLKRQRGFKTLLKVDITDMHLSFFYIAKQPDNNFLVKQDFRLLLEAILEEHPGLEFLKVELFLCHAQGCWHHAFTL